MRFIVQTLNLRRALEHPVHWWRSPNVAYVCELQWVICCAFRSSDPVLVWIFTNIAPNCTSALTPYEKYIFPSDYNRID